MYHEWMTYSLDLRKKALKYLDKTGDRKKVAEAFGITLRTLANWIRRMRENCLAPKPRRSSPSLIDSQKLRSFIQEHPDAYLREIAKEFGSTLQAVFYACKRLKISLKKRSLITKNVMKKKEGNFSRKSKRSQNKIESTSMKAELTNIWKESVQDLQKVRKCMERFLEWDTREKALLLHKEAHKFYRPFAIEEPATQIFSTCG